jgi:hypothetical protein
MNGIDNGANLWSKRLSLVDLHWYSEDLIDGKVSKHLDLSFVFVSERVGEVEYEQILLSVYASVISHVKVFSFFDRWS